MLSASRLGLPKSFCEDCQCPRVAGSSLWLSGGKIWFIVQRQLQGWFLLLAQWRRSSVLQFTRNSDCIATFHVTVRFNIHWQIICITLQNYQRYININNASQKSIRCAETSHCLFAFDAKHAQWKTMQTDRIGIGRPMYSDDTDRPTAAVFKLGSADQRGSATGSHGVRERITLTHWFNILMNISRIMTGSAILLTLKWVTWQAASWKS